MSAVLKQFLHWSKTAPEDRRAEATSALVRAFLYSTLSREDQEAAEATITLMLRDPSVLVRQAIADACAGCQHTPKHLILSLIQDVPEVAAIVVERSPLLLDAELVDVVAEGNVCTQIAVARRQYVSYPVSAALCEIAAYEGCLMLAHNHESHITPNSFVRLLERFDGDADLREALLARHDLPMGVRHRLVQTLNKSLTGLLSVHASPQNKRLDLLEKDSYDRLTLKLAETANVKELTELVIYLRDTEQLTTELLLRAACLGNLMFFEIALADLANQPLTRVVALVGGRSRNAFRALCKKAGLPESSWQAFEIAVETWHQTVQEDHPYEKRFARKMVERILTKYEMLFTGHELDGLMTMLRRLATDIAREDAEAFIESRMSA